MKIEEEKNGEVRMWVELFQSSNDKLAGCVKENNRLREQNIELMTHGKTLMEENEYVMEMNLVLAKEIQRLNGLLKQTT